MLLVVLALLVPEVVQEADLEEPSTLHQRNKAGQSPGQMLLLRQDDIFRAKRLHEEIEGEE